MDAKSQGDEKGRYFIHSKPNPKWGDEPKGLVFESESFVWGHPFVLFFAHYMGNIIKSEFTSGYLNDEFFPPPNRANS